jgi:hypothetical protein
VAQGSTGSGAAVALGGVVLVIARMPSRVSREALDPKRDGALSKQPIDEFGP